MSDLIYKLATKMVARATDFVGLVEIKDNAVWDDPKTPEWDKEKSRWLTWQMSRINGWEPGAPYCIAFDGAIAVSCLESLGLPAKGFLDKWTAHVMTNYNMLRRMKLNSQAATVGSIWMAQLGETTMGHAGIVAVANSRSLTTVEANTMPEGGDKAALKQRNGNGIWIRNFSPKGRGKLVTKGFCSPEAVLALAGIKP